MIGDNNATKRTEVLSITIQLSAVFLLVHTVKVWN